MPLTEVEKDIAQRLRKHVQYIAAEVGPRSLTVAPENLEKVAGYIEQLFELNDFRVESQNISVDLLDFTHPPSTARSITSANAKHVARNVIGELPGRKRADEIIIVGAHYDSVYGCPAANDNGSGVAAMLEIARALCKSEPNRTIRFVAFPNEEPPFFRSEAMGSLRYARSCRERHDKIVGMMSLETMGYFSDQPDSQTLPHAAFKLIYPSTGNFIGFVANWASRNLLRQSMQAFRDAVKFPSEGAVLPELIRGVALSDHSSFWDHGYPAIMITDTAFYRYPHYHTSEDTPDKLDYDRLARVVHGVTEVVRTISR